MMSITKASPMMTESYYTGCGAKSNANQQTETTIAKTLSGLMTRRRFEIAVSPYRATT